MSSEAQVKINKELEEFRKRIMEDKPERIYQNAINIIFTEGTAYYTNQLADVDDELAKLIMVEGKTLAACTNHVMNKARSVCGGMGADLPTEQFHKFIWDYFKMPVEVAKTAISLASERRKQGTAKQALHQQKSLDMLKTLSDQFMDTSNAVNPVYLICQNNGK